MTLICDHGYRIEDDFVCHLCREETELKLPITDEMVERAAIRLCHWDGWDYGEPYDAWPEKITDSDGSVWEPREDAMEDYRDRARAIVKAALAEVDLILVLQQHGGKVVETQVIGKPPLDWHTALLVMRRGSYLVVPLEGSSNVQVDG